jgi:cytochrome c551/c552
LTKKGKGEMANNSLGMMLFTMMLSMTAYAEEAPKTDVPPEIQAHIKELGCISCHGMNRTKFGPSWQDVADRYRGKTVYLYKGFNLESEGEKLPLVQGLVKKVSKGGKGEWNDFIPMIPNDAKGAHLNEITNIVNYVLSIPPKK